MASVLIERVMGIVEPRIPMHQLMGIIAEWARGQITGQQAQNAIIQCSRVNSTEGAAVVAALQPDDITEAQNLLATIPTGGTVENKADRALREAEIRQVLTMAATLLPPYDAPAAVRSRLGLPP